MALGASACSNLYALRLQIGGKKGYARHIAAGLVEAGDEAKLDRVVASYKYNRNSRGRRLCCACGRKAHCSDYCYLTMNKIGRQRRHPIILTSSPAIFDHDVLALEKACLDQTFSECSNNWARFIR